MYLEEVVVDQVDNLQVSGKDLLQHGNWPSLQGLREDRVIRVGERLYRDPPGLVPRESFNVHKDPQ